MTATIQERAWDFSHVLDLVNTLHPTPGGKDYKPYDNDADSKQDLTPSQGLGDFGRIFQYLGTPIDSPTPAPAVQAPRAQEVDNYIHIKDDYASDGATYFKALTNTKKIVQPEENNSIEEQVTDTVSDGSVVPNTPSLTKTQRKKKNRKERRAREAALAAEQPKKAPPVCVSESEADTISKKTPARKASAHVIPRTPTPRYHFRERDSSGKAITASKKETDLDAVTLAIQKVNAAKEALSNRSKASPTPTKATVGPAQPVKTGRPTDPAPSSRTTTESPQAASTQTKSVLPRRISTLTANTAQFLPSSVQPPSRSVAKSPALGSQPAPTHVTASAPSKPAHIIEPMTVRSGEDRHWALLMKLIGDFYEDRKHLIAPMNLTTHNNDPKGIHVFVDASNIFIGFNDQLKRSRGIPPWIQVPAVDLSFDALALLMERRRPVAKRVLAGSTPYLPAFDKAKAVGYECSILEKVYKARELTERQIYFKELDRTTYRYGAKAPPANNVATVNVNASGTGSGSGSETNTPQYAPARMIEQGVDEILHLKILESIVDTDAPGIIVLATGDAAQAEYSQGFMAMAERALKKGWTVELVSWSKNISAMYTRREWARAWGERFKIVTLDDYAEELLDM